MNNFVKAATTVVSVEKSQADIIAVLNRYGASGFGFRRVFEVVEVTFHMPTTEGQPDRTVMIPVSLDVLHRKLQAHNDRRVARGGHMRRVVPREQAERVAWRVLLDWIDAALLAVAMGAQTLEEAFFAHSVVTTQDGQTGRMIDYVHAIETAAGAEPGSGLLPTPGRPLLQLTHRLVSGDR